MKPGATLYDLRRHAIARSLFTPTSLSRAIERIGFVQADPIRAPARAQDLTLRHRVKDYRVGDLERRYVRPSIEEDFFVNYGFLPRATVTLVHPREAEAVWTPARWKQAHAVLNFVREHGVVNPDEVDARFQHGQAENWFSGTVAPARGRWTACTTAGCCARRAAKPGCACTLRAIHTRWRTTRRRLTTRWWTWPWPTVRRCLN